MFNTRSVFFCLALAGCATTPPPVAKQWSDNMRELDILPIFPPRADVRVGDVYAVPLCEYKDTNTRFNAVGHRVGILEPVILDKNAALSKTLAEENKKRVKLPDMPAPSAPGKLDANPSEYINAIRPGKDDGAIQRMSQVAFPGFLKAEVHGGDISAFLSANGLPIPIGITFSSDSRAIINIPRADSYSVSTSILVKAFDENIQEILPSTLFKQEEDYGQSNCNGKLLVTVLSEVFYARSFDVSLNANAAAALSLGTDTEIIKTANAVELNRSDDSAKNSVEAPEKEVVTDTSVIQSKLPSEVISAANTAKNISAKNKSLLTSKGGIGEFYNSWGQYISMRRSYQEPIAIGFRGVRFVIEYNNTPQITKISTTLTSHPTGAKQKVPE